MFLSFFISPRDLRAPSADRRDTSPHDRKYVQFYNPGPKIWGNLTPKKIWSRKRQNLARFWTTSDFDREYLRNGWGYRKWEIHVIHSDSSRVRQKSPVNFGPLTTFSEGHISALMSCCSLKCVHMLENDQGLLSHTSPGTGVPQQFLTIKFKKNCLQFSVLSVITFGPKGNNLMKFFHVKCREAGMKIWVNFWGARTPQKFRPQFGAISDNFRL